VVAPGRRAQAERLGRQAVRESRLRIDGYFRALWDNADDDTTSLGNVVLNRGYDWLSEGSVVVDWAELDRSAMLTSEEPVAKEERPVALTGVA